MSILISGLGTSEVRWLPWLEQLAPPALDLSAAPSRVVVVAPHPDDEVLGCGGLIALLCAAGRTVELVSVTDGEASNPGGSLAPGELARRRTAETARAVARLGEVARTRLQLPDGGAEALEPAVLQALLDAGPAWLVAPWSGDGHPDHEAVGRAAETAAARTGARLLAYPVWAWHWAVPADRRMPWPQAVLVPLPAGARAAKTEAVAELTTQIAPIGPLPSDAPVLGPQVLARFARPYEIFFA